jgi:hypothetical protein
VLADTPGDQEGAMSSFLDLAETIRRHGLFGALYTDPGKVPDFSMSSRQRVQAHIYVAALAFLLHRAIEKKLKAARLDLSATEALTALKSVRVVDINLGDGTAKRSVTTGTNRAAVLRALGITELEPSTPPQPGETVM